MLGRTKDQIRTTEQVNAALKACTDLKLDGLVIIGGTYCSLSALLVLVIMAYCEVCRKISESMFFLARCHIKHRCRSSC